MKVHKKLNQARSVIHSMNLTKSGKNPHLKMSYFELKDFIPAVIKTFNEIGLCGVVSFDSELAKLTIICTESGESIVITSPMGSANLRNCHEVQNIGAVETYQRRYLWLTALELIEADELDASLQPQQPQQQPKQQPKHQPVEAPNFAQNLTDSQIKEACTWMREERTMDGLREIFGAHWNMATDEQRAILKPVYDKRKEELSQ